MFPLTSYHLVVNDQNQNFIYKRKPIVVMVMSILFLLTIGGGEAIRHPFPTWFHVLLWAGTIPVGIVAVIILFLFITSIFMRDFDWLFSTKIIRKNIGKDKISVILPKLSVDVHDNLPAQVERPCPHNHQTACLISKATRSNNRRLRSLLQEEEQERKTQEQKRVAEQEVALRQQWQH